jgi:hypothetical protein
MKKVTHKDMFLDELRRIPVVQVACEKTGLSRNTIYRWKREDNDFAKSFDQAVLEGIAFVNDMSESQLLQLIKEKKFSALRFWLINHHERFSSKSLSSKSTKKSELSDEQKQVISQALAYAKVTKKDHESTSS